MEFDLHFGSMLASFSMFVALLFRASILHGFVIKFAMDFMYCSKSVYWFPWSYIQLTKHSKTLVFRLLCIVYTFANTCLFHNCRDMLRCSLLHHLLLYCAPKLASLWYECSIKTYVFVDTTLLTISWCVFWRLLAPKMLYGAPQIIKNHIFRNHAFRISTGWVWSVPVVVWSHFGIFWHRFLMHSSIFWSIGVEGGGKLSFRNQNHTIQ